MTLRPTTPREPRCPPRPPAPAVAPSPSSWRWSSPSPPPAGRAATPVDRRSRRRDVRGRRVAPGRRQRLPGRGRAQVRHDHDRRRPRADRDRRPDRPGHRPGARHRARRHHPVVRHARARGGPLGRGPARRRDARGPRRRRHQRRAHRRPAARPDPRGLLGAHRAGVRHALADRPDRGPARRVRRLRRAVAGPDPHHRPRAGAGRRGRRAGRRRRGPLRGRARRRNPEFDGATGVVATPYQGTVSVFSPQDPRGRFLTSSASRCRPSSRTSPATTSPPR